MKKISSVAIVSNISTERAFTVASVFNQSWQTFKKNWALLVGIFFATMFAPSLLDGLIFQYLPTEMNLFCQFVVFLISVYVSLVVIRVQLALLRNQELTKENILVSAGNVGRTIGYCLALIGVIIGVIIVLGLGYVILSGALTVLKAIPGISGTTDIFLPIVMTLYGIVSVIGLYWYMLRLMLGQILVLDQSMGPITALKKSFAMTKGYPGAIFRFSIIMAFLSFLGLMNFIFPAIILNVMMMLGLGYIYIRLSQQAQGTLEPEDASITNPRPLRNTTLAFLVLPVLIVFLVLIVFRNLAP